MIKGHRWTGTAEPWTLEDLDPEWPVDVCIIIQLVFAHKYQNTCSNVMLSGHCGGRGLLCERRRAELQVPCRENRLPLGLLQHNIGGF